MVTVANLNQPAPPLNDIVVELSVPISFDVSVISAESALPFTLRAEGNRPECFFASCRFILLFCSQ
ncbi:hypothetical protein B6Q00_25240 [Escherichia coli]|nr:hypothetical protein [Escherichia coli]